MLRRRKTAMRLPIAICASAALAGCATSQALVTPKTAVSIPPPPPYMRPVGEPVKVGTAPNDAFLQERNARRSADRIIVKSRAAWETMRARYRGAKIK